MSARLGNAGGWTSSPAATTICTAWVSSLVLLCATCSSLDQQTAHRAVGRAAGAKYEMICWRSSRPARDATWSAQTNRGERWRWKEGRTEAADDEDEEEDDGPTRDGGLGLERLLRLELVDLADARVEGGIALAQVDMAAGLRALRRNEVGRAEGDEGEEVERARSARWTRRARSAAHWAVQEGRAHHCVAARGRGREGGAKRARFHVRLRSR